MFLKIGHRGASAYETENTLDSFKRAIELGANAAEFDVRESKDGRLVVIHDDNLRRVFGQDIRVKEATLSELKKLTDNRIPTPEEALQFIDKKVEKVLLELKEVGHEGKALDAIEKEGFHERVIVVSFHEEALSNLREADNTIETGLIYSRHRNPVETALRLNVQYLMTFYKHTRKKSITDAHKKNLKIIVWTVNTEKEIKEYAAMGVDGIASDRPDLFGSI
jgi:glycerophosphoryl diester phosphodiesterase